jgi:thymidine phosphorylase
MLPQEIIRKKRDGAALDPAEIEWFVRGLTEERITEGQVAAFAMAVLFRGMTIAERTALTLAMARSGQILDWRDLNLPGPVVDKHSTGGVGDKVSLILAPLAAACGLFVPMISGRGLGHTGGTLDKLEAISGYNVKPDRETLRRVVKEIGCAIVGQTDDLAPADRRLYAIRDVTATVESIDLITASILSKKMAAGLDALVMDVKFGSGAFMPEPDRARALARSIVDVANSGGVRTTALLTDMNQPLGDAAGNAVEVLECVRFLRGEARDARLWSVTRALAVEMLVLGGVADRVTAELRVDAALESGAAAERFARMVAALGGPRDLLERASAYLKPALVIRPAAAARAGFVRAIDVRAVGLAVVSLGGGRMRVSDQVDHRVGLTYLAGIGAPIGPDRPLALVHAADDASADAAIAGLRAAYTIGESPGESGPLVAEVVRAS